MKIKELKNNPLMPIIYGIEKIGIFRFSDKFYLQNFYKYKIGKKLDLSNPHTFNEKLQWLKLHDRKEIYTLMVDKYEVKKYVSSIIGEEYIVPTLGIYEKFEDIDFDKLPNQFVIKCTHDSGGLVIVKDKSKLDIKSAGKKINKCLKKNFYYYGREWPYKNVKPRIIIEKYIASSNEELIDYKFFCFNGKVRLMFIATNRFGIGDTCFDFFDEKFKHLNIINGHKNAINPPQKPKNYEKMIKIAEELSKDILHVRIDFYEVDGKIYFGEMTFYHWSGFVPFEPVEWDEKIGNWIDL